MYYKIHLIKFFIYFELSEVVVESLTVDYCKDITSSSTDLKLKTYLFCDYDPDLRPEVGQKNVINVGMTIMYKMIEFDDVTNILTVHSLTAVNWTDPHLSWNPPDFNGVDNLRISSKELWVPDITIHNAGDLDVDQQGIPSTICRLSHDGGIQCLPAAKYTSRCESDYTNYPYDVQNCSIEFSSLSYSSDEVSLNLMEKSFVSADYTPNKEWKFLAQYITSEPQNFKISPNYSSHIYKLKLTLQRRAAGIHTIYISPAIVLMVMTLSVLWLDCHSSERMILACLSFICHLICIQDLQWVIPHNGAVLPNILKFYESSFLLIAFSLVLTVLLQKLGNVRKSAPQWLSSSTAYILQSKIGQLLLLSILDPKASAFLEKLVDENDDLVQEKQTDSTWDYLVLLIGWLAFLSVSCVYSIMLVYYLPSSPSFGILSYTIDD